MTCYSSGKAKWSPAKDNNYVKNGSFEADRNSIPSNFKPIQKRLLGWTTTITDGNQVEVNDEKSPVLNHLNSESDRKVVTGKKSLHISDKISFKRKIAQLISSSANVPIADGSYTLTARFKNSSGFSKLEMYAESGGSIFKYSIQNENSLWQTFTVRNIAVKGGKVEIGFLAEATANAFCDIDDVSLVKNR